MYLEEWEQYLGDNERMIDMTTKQTAYQAAQAYRETVAAKLEALKASKRELQAQADTVAREMTSAAGLLKGDEKQSAQLKEIRAEMAAIDDQLTAIDAAGGLDGILRNDAKMQELADAAFRENKERLEELAGEKDDMIVEIRERFYDFEDLEQRAQKQTDAVEMLENEIDEIKQFVSSVDLPPKSKYRYKAAAVPRSVNYLFSDIKKALENLKREGVLK